MDYFKEVKKLSGLHKIIPARSKRQNFLIDENAYELMIEAAELTKGDTVLEVGPGFGFLTERLARFAGKVIAVELDDKLAGVLRMRMDSLGVKNVEVVNLDILEFSIFNSQFSQPKADSCLAGRQAPLVEINNQFSNLNRKLTPPDPPLTKGAAHKGSRFFTIKVVANLPYNITSIFLRKFLSADIKPEMMVLMLQKEVAERICANPGAMSMLAVSVRFFADPEIIAYVKQNAFWPAPEVESAIIKLKLHNANICQRRTSLGLARNIGANDANKISEKDFFRMVKFGFSSRRKMLKNNLAGGLRISQKEAGDMIIKAGFDPKIRAQELSVEDWVKLYKIFNNFVF
jgi:16S rRNA (adenine1518-N6/adenine1519-N6)-dimethyltransferase